MKNTGTPPDTGNEPIDIRFRNGQVRRCVIASKWRWKPWDHGESAYDITDWQYADARPLPSTRAA